MNVLIKPSFLRGSVQAISSKSDIHRILFCAAAADKPTDVYINGLSEDILASVRVLNTLGAEITAENHIIRVKPIIKNSNLKILDCGECGAASRFVLPFAAAMYDGFTLTGSGSLLKRPFRGLTAVMGRAGCAIDGDYLPITIKNRLKSGIFEISGDISSQYITGLLLALPLLEGESEIRLASPLKSAGYIDMTINTMKKFGVAVEKRRDSYFIKPSRFISPGVIHAEGDWSNAAFWLCGGAVNGDIEVSGLDKNSLQADKNIIDILKYMNAYCDFENGCFYAKKSGLCPANIDADHIPDLIMAVAAAAIHASGKTVVTNAERLKLKESDRIQTLTEVITAFGGGCEYADGTFIINGKTAENGYITIESRGDHRVVMLGAILAAAGESEVLIKNAEAVNKSYPGFFGDFKKLGGKADVV